MYIVKARLASFFFVLFAFFLFASAADSAPLPKYFSLKLDKTYTFPLMSDSRDSLIYVNGSFYAGLKRGFIYEFKIKETDGSVEIKSKYKIGDKDVAGLGWDGKYFYVSFKGQDSNKLKKYKKIKGKMKEVKSFFMLGAGIPNYGFAFLKNKVYNFHPGGFYSNYTLGEDAIGWQLNQYVATKAYLGISEVEGKLYALSGGHTMPNGQYKLNPDISDIVEIDGDKKVYHPIKGLKLTDLWKKSYRSLAYDGANFWTMSADGLVKLAVKHEKTNSEKRVLSPYSKKGKEIDYEGYQNLFHGTVGNLSQLVWDGKDMWLAIGELLYRVDTKSGVIYRQPITISNNINKYYYYLKTLSWHDGYFYLIGNAPYNSKEVGERQLLKLKLYDDKVLGLFLKVVSSEPLPKLGKLIAKVAWIDDRLIIATGQNTRDTNEGHGFTELVNKNNKWKVSNSYDNPAIRSEALAWDGEFMWSYDVFSKSVYKLDKNLNLVSHYEKKDLPSSSRNRGFAWDGKALWSAMAGRGGYTLVKVDFKDIEDIKSKKNTKFNYRKPEVVSPKLVFKAQIVDEGRDGFFSPGEGFSFVLAYQNRGEGVADNVKLVLGGDQEIIDSFKLGTTIGPVYAGLYKRLVFPRRLPEEINKKKLKLTIKLVDSNGIESGNSETIEIDIVAKDNGKGYKKSNPAKKL